MKDYKKLTDEQIVEIVRQKDKETYEEIVKRYETKLIRYIVYLIKDKQRSIDIVQESFIKAYINLNSFDIKKKFSSWLYRIAHNTAMNYVDKYKKEVRLFEGLHILSHHNIEEDLVKKETIKRIKRCLDQLSLIYSEPLALYFLEDKSYEEISDILRIPMGTVATRINRAKLQMKQLCQKKQI